MKKVVRVNDPSGEAQVSWQEDVQYLLGVYRRPTTHTYCGPTSYLSVLLHASSTVVLAHCRQRQEVLNTYSGPTVLDPCTINTTHFIHYWHTAEIRTEDLPQIYSTYCTPVLPCTSYSTDTLPTAAGGPQYVLRTFRTSTPDVLQYRYHQNTSYCRRSAAEPCAPGASRG